LEVVGKGGRGGKETEGRMNEEGGGAGITSEKGGGERAGKQH